LAEEEKVESPKKVSNKRQTKEESKKKRKLNPTMTLSLITTRKKRVKLKRSSLTKDSNLFLEDGEENFNQSS
jgi:hypothetical protein